MPNRRSIEPGDGDPAHGTDYGYCALACRCPPCRTAHAEKMLAYKDRPGVRKRIQQYDRERKARKRQARTEPDRRFRTDEEKAETARARNDRRNQRRNEKRAAERELRRKEERDG